VRAAQAALVVEVLKISAWTPSMNVHPQIKHCFHYNLLMSREYTCKFNTLDV